MINICALVNSKGALGNIKIDIALMRAPKLYALPTTLPNMAHDKVFKKNSLIILRNTSFSGT